MSDPKPLEVRHDDGEWYPAKVEHRYRTERGWRAVVRYSVAGANYMRAVDQADVRVIDPFDQDRLGKVWANG